jgi:outer membrane cobalamin receptor
MRVVCCMVLAAVCFAQGAFSQVQSGEVRVRITDPSGLPLPSTVSLTSEASRTHRDAKTTDAGEFTFQHLPFGVYQLIVERPGFMRSSTTVEVRSSVPKELRISLGLESAETKVEVRAEQTIIDPHETGVEYAVGSQQLKEQMSTVPGRAVLDLVNSQPGWIFEANGVLHPRGSEYQTQFVVDGMPLEENRSPGFAPGLDAGEISEMTVLTGNIPAEYGRKLGGVIEVTTTHDTAQGLHGSAGVGGGSFDAQTGFINGTYGWAHSAISFDGDASRTERYLDPPVLKNYTNSGTTAGFGAGYSIDLSAKDRLFFSGRWSAARFEVPNENVQQAAGQRQDRDTPEEEGRASWTHVLSPDALLSVRGSVEDLSANLWSNTLATPVIASQARAFRRSYLNSTVSVQKGRYEWKFGGDALYAPVTERLQDQITDPSYFDEGTALAFQFAGRRLDREQAAFAQGTAHYGNLSLSAGLRFDHYSLVVKDHVWSPRLGAAYYFPKAGLLLRFSYDRVFQTPAMENLLLASSTTVDQVSDEVLRIPVRPSRGNYLETGFTQAIGKQARLDVSFYRRTFSNYADDDVFLNTGINFPIAFHSAQVQGVDVKLDLPHWHALSGFVSYSNMIGTAQLPVAGGLFLGSDVQGVLDQGTFPITQDQRNTARARGRYQIGSRGWVAAEAQYNSGLPVEIDSDVNVPDLEAQYGSRIVDRVNFAAGRIRPHFALNLNAGVDLWKREQMGLKLEGEIDNLTDQVNVINFASLFSGTAVGIPRSGALRLSFTF